MKIKLVLFNLIICFFLFNCTKNVDRMITFDENFEYSEISIICKAIELNMSIKEKFINMKERKTGSSSFNFKNSFIYMFKNILILLSSISINFKK